VPGTLRKDRKYIYLCCTAVVVFIYVISPHVPAPRLSDEWLSSILICRMLVFFVLVTVRHSLFFTHITARSILPKACIYTFRSVSRMNSDNKQSVLTVVVPHFAQFFYGTVGIVTWKQQKTHNSTSFLVPHLLMTAAFDDVYSELLRMSLDMIPSLIITITTIINIQGGSNMTGTNCDLFTHKSSRSYLNHLLLNSYFYVFLTVR
jgi:hypothetical protein